LINLAQEFLDTLANLFPLGLESPHLFGKPRNLAAEGRPKLVSGAAPLSGAAA